MNDLILTTVDDPLNDLVSMWGCVFILCVTILFVKEGKNIRFVTISLLGAIGVLIVLTLIYFGLAVKEASGINELELRVAAYNHLGSNGVRVALMILSLVLLGLFSLRKNKFQALKRRR